MAPHAFIGLRTVSFYISKSDAEHSKGLILREGGVPTDMKCGSLYCTSGHLLSSLFRDLRQVGFSGTAEVISEHYLLDWKRDLLSVEPVEFIRACPFPLGGKSF